MALQAESLADLIISTHRNEGKHRWTDLSTSLRKFSAYPAMVKQGKKMIETDGTGFQFNVQKAGINSAYDSGFFQTDQVDIQDVLAIGYVPWRGLTNAYAFDLAEPVMNSGDSRIVDEILARKHKCWIDIATAFETRFWSLPPSSSDTDKPFGVPYWIVQSATDSDEDTGLTGGNPTGFSSGAAGIDSTLPGNDQWKNWSKKYKDITFPDAITKLSEAYVMCNFECPVPQPPGYNTGDDWGIYTSYNNIAQCEQLLRSQNENLGNDLASKDGMTIFRGVPLTRVSQLATDATLKSTKPFYGINWGVFMPKFLSGWFMKDSGAKPAPDKHNVVQSFIDNRYQYVCTDRRAQFVVYYSAS